jgi:DNA invertase Pin-like site-specific DNA recombinase
MFSLSPDAHEPTALLARVSGEDQQRNETIQPQLDFLRKHAELHQLNVAGVYIDDGVSGAIALDERPDGRRLVEDAKAGRFKRVIVYRLDRLARTLNVLMGAYELLDSCGVSIQSATEPFDTGTPFGRAMFQFLGIMAELERATIAERTAGGRDRVASLGQYTGGPIPYGLDLDEARKSSAVSPTITPRSTPSASGSTRSVSRPPSRATRSRSVRAPDRRRPSPGCRSGDGPAVGASRRSHRSSRTRSTRAQASSARAMGPSSAKRRLSSTR